MASDEMLQAITKHAMGGSFEFEVLKERFKEDLYWCADKSVAAALGYLIAKDELEAANEEEEEPDVYDEVVGIIKKYCPPPGNNSAHTAADEIFTLIYEWLKEEITAKGIKEPFLCRVDLQERFSLFVIKKSEA
jgi:hypothetical protein